MIEEWLSFLRDNAPKLYEQAVASIKHQANWRDKRIEELEARIARLTSRGFEDLHYENQQLLRVIDAVDAIGPVHKSWNVDDDFCLGWDKCMEQVREILRGEETNE